MGGPLLRAYEMAAEHMFEMKLVCDKVFMQPIDFKHGDGFRMKINRGDRAVLGSARQKCWEE